VYNNEISRRLADSDELDWTRFTDTQTDRQTDVIARIRRSTADNHSHTSLTLYLSRQQFLSPDTVVHFLFTDIRALALEVF